MEIIAQFIKSIFFTKGKADNTAIGIFVRYLVGAIIGVILAFTLLLLLADDDEDQFIIDDDNIEYIESSDDTLEA